MCRVHCVGCTVQGEVCRVQCECRVQGAGFSVSAGYSVLAGCSVQCAGSSVSAGCRVHSAVCSVQGAVCVPHGAGCSVSAVKVQNMSPEVRTKTNSVSRTEEELPTLLSSTKLCI